MNVRFESQGAPWCTLAAIGDIGIIGSARARMATDADAPFAALAPALRAADVAFANLEFPVGEASLVREGRSPEFFHSADVPAALARAGVHVVSLANNHMMDCGPEGLRRTLAACRDAGLLHVGAGEDLAAARRPACLEVQGRRIVVLAYSQTNADVATASTPGVAPLDAALIREDVMRWRGEADVLVLSLHWGAMYVDVPPPRVRALLAQLAELPVDAVLGHHPHVLQGAERRGRMLVLYSLGDAVFNCHAGDFTAEVAAQRRLESGVFTLRFAHDAHGLMFEPTRLDPDGIPGAASGGQAVRWESLCEALADADAHFREVGAPMLLKYELQSLMTYVRQGRWDRVVRLLGAIRPRHLSTLWMAIARGRSGIRRGEST